MARGFLAELNRQLKIAAREQVRSEREDERARKAASRDAERARKAEAVAAKKFDRAQLAEKKRLDKEAREAHVVNPFCLQPGRLLIDRSLRRPKRVSGKLGCLPFPLPFPFFL